MTKSERQRRLLEIISVRRYETIPNLAEELGVSRYTIMRDLDEVTAIASFYTVAGREDRKKMQNILNTFAKPKPPTKLSLQSIR